MLLPRLKWRWSAVRMLARAFLFLMGIPLSVRNIEKLPKERAVIVFNHASYADAIVLAAVLPGEPAYLVKKELASDFFAGPLLRRLGVLFIDRYDLTRGWLCFQRVHLLGEQDSSSFSLEPSRSQAKPACRFIRAFCAVRDQFFEVTNGFHAGAASTLKSLIPSYPVALILSRSCTYATRSVRQCYPAAENRICANW